MGLVKKTCVRCGDEFVPDSDRRNGHSFCSSCDSRVEERVNDAIERFQEEREEDPSRYEGRDDNDVRSSVVNSYGEAQVSAYICGHNGCTTEVDSWGERCYSCQREIDRDIEERERVEKERDDDWDRFKRSS